MSLWGKIKGLFSRPDRGFTPERDRLSRWLSAVTGGQTSKAGVSVGPESATKLSTYYACLLAVSDDTAKLPIVMREEYPDGSSISTKETDPGLFNLIAVRPCPIITAVDFYSMLTSWAQGWGLGLAIIRRDATLNPVELWPVHPSRVTPLLFGDQLVYDCVLGDEERATRYHYTDVIAIRGLGTLETGFSVARLACDGIGLGLAAESNAANFFSNNSQLVGILEYPGSLGTDTADSIRDSFVKKYSGQKKSYMPLVLEGGAKYTPLSINPRDSQMIEARAFQVEDVCRWFRMPPHKVQHLQKATMGNVEHGNINYANEAILPWVTRWNQELTYKLLLGRKYTRLFHDMSSLTQGDTASQTEEKSKSIMFGWRTIDEVRRLEGRDKAPRGLGSEHYIQSSMVPLGVPNETPNSSNP